MHKDCLLCMHLFAKIHNQGVQNWNQMMESPNHPDVQHKDKSSSRSLLLFHSCDSMLLNVAFQVGQEMAFLFSLQFQSHASSGVGSEGSGVSPAQSTDGYDHDEHQSREVGI